MQYFANIITGFRIILSLALLPTEVFSVTFYMLYTFAGTSDICDGVVARWTHSKSMTGATLDSIGDLFFIAVLSYKLYPILADKVDVVIWLTILAVLILRMLTYVIGANKYHRFVSFHTYLNKLTGLGLFAGVYILEVTAHVNMLSSLPCALAAAATEEFIIVCKSRNYHPEIKSVFDL